MSDRGAQKREQLASGTEPEPQQKKRIARVRVREISLKGTPPFGVIEIDRDTQVVTVHKPGDVPEFGEDEDDGESEDT